MSDTLRVLTVRQPWAWAIIHGGKDVENRTRNIAGAYRGPVAIHAGLAVDESIEDPDDPMYGLIFGPCPNSGDEQHNRYTCEWCTEIQPEQYGNAGCVIGIADLVGVHPDCTESVEGYGHLPTCSPWAMSDHQHITLVNPRPLAHPIPAKGRLGLWHPGAELEAAIWEQVAA